MDERSNLEKIKNTNSENKPIKQKTKNTTETTPLTLSNSFYGANLMTRLIFECRGVSYAQSVFLTIAIRQSSSEKINFEFIEFSDLSAKKNP